MCAAFGAVSLARVENTQRFQQASGWVGPEENPEPWKN